MSHRLMLRVESDVQATGGRVVVFARALDGGEDLETAVPLRQDSALELQAGRYLLEAVLPSGERLRRVVDVPAQREVTLQPSRSPNEWLGFQHLLVRPQRLASRVGLESTGTATPPAVYLLQDWPAAWKGSGLRLAAESRTPLRVDPTTQRFPSNSSSAVHRFDIPPLKPSSKGRGAAIVVMGDRRKCIPIAHEWKTEDYQSVHTELVVNTQRQSISTAIADPHFAQVLAYLSGGRSDLAATSLGKLPMDLLLEKVRNPYAAAAGAYVLIDELRDVSRAPRWRSWIRNLANWFPDLADGAILEGRALMHANQPDAALERFLEAFDRGIPFFAEGVRLLLEGLLSFPEEDPRLDEATRAVRQWASWLDPRESFTTLAIPVPVIIGATPPPLALSVPV